MTKTQTFQADESKRDQLRDALPVVMEALDAIKDELEYGKVNAGVTSDVVGNSFFQQIVGAKYLITNLEKMTRVAKVPTELKGRRQFTEDDRDMLKQQEEH